MWGAYLILRFSLLHYYFNINLLRVRTIWAAAFVLCLLAWRIPRPLRLGDRKGVPANHPPDGLLSLFAHLFGALRAPLRGPAVHGPSPFVAARHFPHSVGESSRAPAESPLSAPVGALFVRHWRTAPFEKAGETFMFCSLVA